MPVIDEYTDTFLNYYECPECSEHWYDIWDCAVDDQCPGCLLKAVTPTGTWLLPDGGIENLAVWKGAFEPLTDD